MGEPSRGTDFTLASPGPGRGFCGSWNLPLELYRKIPFLDFAGREAALRNGDSNTRPENVQVVASLRALVWGLASSKGTIDPTKILHCLALTLHTPNSLEVAYLLSTLGCQLNTVGRHREAEHTHRRALCIAATRLGTSHLELSHCLDLLGLSLYMQGKFTEALLVCYSNEKIIEENFGRKHPNVCGCLLNMAAVYDAMGWFLYACEKREEAVSLYSNLQAHQTD